MKTKWMGAAALVFGALSFAGAALAQAVATWTEPGEARFSLSRPAGWPVDAMSDSSPAVRHYAAGLAAAECGVYAIRRDSSANRSGEDVRRAFTAPLTTAQWVQVLGSIRAYRGVTAIQSSSVESTTYFPIQRATFATPDGTVHAGLHARPGLEVWVFCQSFDARDRTAQFNQVIRSVATPRDAEYQAAGQAAAPAAPPALAPAPSTP